MFVISDAGRSHWYGDAGVKLRSHSSSYAHIDLGFISMDATTKAGLSGYR